MKCEKLDLGSGGRRFKGYVSLDNDPTTEPDVLCDIESGLPFDDRSFSEVRAYHILEHIHTEKKTFVMNEIWRVLKKDGIADIRLPAFPSTQSVQDPTHVSFWCRGSFMYYEHDNAFRNALARRSHEPIPSFHIVKYNLENGWHLKIKLKAVK